MAGTYIHLKLFTITWLPLAMSIVLIDIYFKKVLCVLIHYRVLLQKNLENGKVFRCLIHVIFLIRS